MIYIPYVLTKDIKYDEKTDKYIVISKPEKITYKEEWKYVVFRGIETKYQISNYGRVKNPNGEICTLYYDKNGYTRFSLWIPKNDPVMKNEKPIRYPYKTHRAVAEAFVPNDDPESKRIVMHKNDIEDCNFYTNLKWGTPIENMQDKMRKGRLKVLHGSNKPDSKFNENDVREICELLERGISKSNEIILLLGKANKDRGYLRSYNNLIANIKRKHCWKEIIRNYNF